MAIRECKIDRQWEVNVTAAENVLKERVLPLEWDLVEVALIIFAAYLHLVSIICLQNGGSSAQMRQILMSTVRWRSKEFDLDFLLNIIVAQICATDSALVPSHKPILAILANFRLINRGVLAGRLIFVHDEEVQVTRIAFELGWALKTTNFSVCVVLNLFCSDFDHWLSAFWRLLHLLCHGLVYTSYDFVQREL